MTVKEYFKITTIETSVDYVARKEDGTEVDLISINGKYYDNLDNGEYYIDSDYASDEENDLITGYEVLLPYTELLDCEVAEVRVYGSFVTVYVKIN